jgi:hypothetical protein
MGSWHRGQGELLHWSIALPKLSKIQSLVGVMQKDLFLIKHDFNTNAHSP